MKNYELSDLLNKTIVCECGKEHSSKVQHVVIEANAIKRVPELMNAHGYKKAFIICDANTIKKVMDNAPHVKDRDHSAIANIMEALVVTGIAMEYAGNSRPASGAEHHLSHYWEMQFLFEGRKAVLHGTKVGIGTIAITYAYNKLKDLNIDFAAAKANVANYDFDAWCEYMKKAYGVSADSVIKMEKKVQKNGTEGRLRRIHLVEAHWSEIKELITNLIPTVAQMEDTLGSLGGAIRPSHVDIPQEMFYNSVCTAKEVRDRYTILQMLWDLGLIEEFSREMSDYLYA